MNKLELAFYNNSGHYKSEIFLNLALPHHRDTLGHFYNKIPLNTSLDDDDDDDDIYIYMYVSRYM